MRQPDNRRIRLRDGLVAALLVIVATTSIATAEPRVAHADALSMDRPLDWGPLTIKSHAILYHQRLGYTPGRIDVLPAGRGEVTAYISHANIWADMKNYFYDAEWTRYGLRASVGLPLGIEAALDLHLLWRGGGFLDAFIMDFHSWFGVTQARRDRFPRDHLRVATEGPNGELLWLDNSDSALGLANPTLTIRKELIRGFHARPALTAELMIKPPIGTGASDSQGWQIGLDLAMRWAFADRFQAFVTIGHLFDTVDQKIFGIPTEKFQVFLMLGLEYRVSENVTFVFHFLYQARASSDHAFRLLSLPTHEFVGGLKWAPGGTHDRWIVELGLIENSINDANTPDFGMHLALHHRFKLGD
jgi:opacity protein-like surface antigen